jgi:hypothetical protein
MRRPALLAILLAVALFAVIYGKYRLDKSIKEGKFNSTEETTVDPDHPMTIDLGVEPDPNKPRPQDAPPHSTGAASHTDVMATLVEARQTFRQKDAVATDASKEPHNTPSAIIQSAEKLGQLITLEQNHPEYRPEFQAFYLECAKDAEVITITRVQCLEKYVQSKKPSPDEEAKVLNEVDPIVKKLYGEMKR